MTERWLESAWTALKDIYNCSDDPYYFWDEARLRERSDQFDNWLNYATNRLQSFGGGIAGAEMPDHGGNVSVVIGNFMKSCYLPVLTNQLANQTLDSSRFEIIFVDTADDPAFLPVVRFCRHRWPNLLIRALETHEDAAQSPTTRRNVGVRQAQYDRILIFDSDWLPIGHRFLESMLKAHTTEETIVRCLVWTLQCGGRTYGRWLQGPKAWVNAHGDPVDGPPPLIYLDRYDHDFALTLSRDRFIRVGGFGERGVGGSGLEEDFFSRFKGRNTYCLDAHACNLQIFPTHFAAERARRIGTPGVEPNRDDNWGNPPTLEDITKFL